MSQDPEKVLAFCVLKLPSRRRFCPSYLVSAVAHQRRCSPSTFFQGVDWCPDLISGCLVKGLKMYTSLGTARAPLITFVIADRQSNASKTQCTLTA